MSARRGAQGPVGRVSLRTTARPAGVVAILRRIAADLDAAQLANPAASRVIDGDR